jgi:hypothetical protein
MAWVTSIIEVAIASRLRSRLLELDPTTADFALDADERLPQGHAPSGPEPEDVSTAITTHSSEPDNNRKPLAKRVGAASTPRISLELLGFRKRLNN